MATLAQRSFGRSAWDVLTYGAILVLVAIGAWVVAPASGGPGARWACEMGCEGSKTYPAAGACPICRMALSRVEGRSFIIQVAAKQGDPTRASPLRVRFFDPAGAPLDSLESHGPRAALLALVSDDLSDASMAWTPVNAAGFGEFDGSLVTPGRHELFAVCAGETGSPRTASTAFTAPGRAPEAVPLVEDFDEVKRVGEYDFRIRCNGALYYPGGVSYLRFGANFKGKPVSDFEPLFGEPAYVLIIEAKTRRVLKTHTLSVAPFLSDRPIDPESNVHVHKASGAAVSGKSDEVNPLTLRNGQPTDIAVQAVFPEPGLYRVFAVFSRGGELICVPFTIDAKSPASR